MGQPCVFQVAAGAPSGASLNPGARSSASPPAGGTRNAWAGSRRDPLRLPQPAGVATGRRVIKCPPPPARAQPQLRPYISLSMCRWSWALNVVMPPPPMAGGAARHAAISTGGPKLAPPSVLRQHSSRSLLEAWGGNSRSATLGGRVGGSVHNI